MLALYLLFYLLAGVFFGLAAGGVAHRRFNQLSFVALGLLFWVLVEIVQVFVKL